MALNLLEQPPVLVALLLWFCFERSKRKKPAEKASFLIVSEILAEPELLAR
jgi:hypothetical protein